MKYKENESSNILFCLILLLSYYFITYIDNEKNHEINSFGRKNSNFACCRIVEFIELANSKNHQGK